MVGFGSDAWWVAYACYAALLAGTAAERVAELLVSARNARWALARGGWEAGRGHFPPMVALHTGLLLACAAEPVLAGRPFLAWLSIPCAVLVLGGQALRWWCIAALGPRWNTRVVVVPGLPLVARGPYRVLPHPNYVVVALEGIVLPLAGTAWVTAVAFTALNAVLLLGFRIPAEERALAAALHEEALR